jgi:hypothetical protein
MCRYSVVVPFPSVTGVPFVFIVAYLVSAFASFCAKVRPVDQLTGLYKSTALSCQ